MGDYRKKDKRFKDLEFLIFNKQCMDCGKKFMARVRAKDGHIMDGAEYFGELTLGLGAWSKYKMGENPDGSIKWIRIISYPRELLYRLIDLKRKILHQYKTIEMWSCSGCRKKDREQWRKEKKQNREARN